MLVGMRGWVGESEKKASTLHPSKNLQHSGNTFVRIGVHKCGKSSRKKSLDVATPEEFATFWYHFRENRSINAEVVRVHTWAGPVGPLFLQIIISLHIIMISRLMIIVLKHCMFI